MAKKKETTTKKQATKPKKETPKKVAKPKKESPPEQEEQPKKPKASGGRNERGQFVKGCAKPANSGRAAGTPNKYGNIRDRLKDIIMPYLDMELDASGIRGKTLASDLMKIGDPNDRVHAVAAILPYIVPKYTSTTISADANRPISEEQHLLEMDAKYTKKEISINMKSLVIVDNDNPDNGDYDPDDDPSFNIDELQ